jgi:hypothetical protein
MFLTLVLNYFSVECELFSKVCKPLIDGGISLVKFSWQ